MAHRRVKSPCSAQQLAARFSYSPRESVTALLRRAGPFIAQRDAFRFSNGGWPITDQDAAVLRAKYQSVVNATWTLGIHALRGALVKFGVQLPFLGTVGLPSLAVDYVISRVSGDLRDMLVEDLIAAIPGRFGRCGGMAFAAYDFFVLGWPVSSFTQRPETGDLREYIWLRLLDSLELNVATFLEWLMIFYALPKLSIAASSAIGAAAGLYLGGPVAGALVGYLAGKEDVLGLGGADALKERTRANCRALSQRLATEAAWPIGLVFDNNPNPADQHQVLALDYKDEGNGIAMLRVWDNNDRIDPQGAGERTLTLDFRGNELMVVSSSSTLNHVKGVICERYSFKRPPSSLHVTP